MKLKIENGMEVEEEMRYNELRQSDKDFECDGCRLTGELLESMINHMKSAHVRF